MASAVRSFSDILRNATGDSAFSGGGGDVVFITPLPAQANMLPNTLYFDPEGKEQAWLTSGGDRCTFSFVEGNRVLLEDFAGRIILEDGSGFLRI